MRTIHIGIFLGIALMFFKQWGGRRGRDLPIIGTKARIGEMDDSEEYKWRENFVQQLDKFWTARTGVGAAKDEAERWLKMNANARNQRNITIDDVSSTTQDDDRLGEVYFSKDEEPTSDVEAAISGGEAGKRKRMSGENGHGGGGGDAAGSAAAGENRSSRLDKYLYDKKRNAKAQNKTKIVADDIVKDYGDDGEDSQQSEEGGGDGTRSVFSKFADLREEISAAGRDGKDSTLAASGHQELELSSKLKDLGSLTPTQQLLVLSELAKYREELFNMQQSLLRSKGLAHLQGARTAFDTREQKHEQWMEAFRSHILQRQWAVDTVAGTPGMKGLRDGSLSHALFHYPTGLTCVEEEGAIYVADKWNHVIRRIELETGVVSTFAGSGSIGSNDGMTRRAQFAFPTDIKHDKEGNLYVSDGFGTHRVRKISYLGHVQTLSERANALNRNNDASQMKNRLGGASSVSPLDLPKTQSPDTAGAGKGGRAEHGLDQVYSKSPPFYVAREDEVVGAARRGALSGAGYPHSSLAISRLFGDVYTADATDACIREFSPVLRSQSSLVGEHQDSDREGGGGGPHSGVDTSIAARLCVDGPATKARFSFPMGISFDEIRDVLYVADARSHSIRTVSLGESWAEGKSETIVQTFAGIPNRFGWRDGHGKRALFCGPGSVLLDDATKGVFVTERYGRRIRAIAINGEVHTIAGGLGGAGGDEGDDNNNEGEAAMMYETTAQVEQKGTRKGPLRCHRDGPASLARFGNLGGIAIVNNVRNESSVRKEEKIASPFFQGLSAAKSSSRSASKSTAPSHLLFVADTSNHCIRRCANYS